VLFQANCFVAPPALPTIATPTILLISGQQMEAAVSLPMLANRRPTSDVIICYEGAARAIRGLGSVLAVTVGAQF
jgi:hypothetical protein